MRASLVLVFAGAFSAVVALLPTDFTRGTINHIGRARDPFGEDDVIMKWQLPASDSAKRSDKRYMYAAFDSVSELVARLMSLTTHRVHVCMCAQPLAVALDVGAPLDATDFARTATLGERDLAPAGRSPLYSPIYFEGDIARPELVRSSCK